MTRTGCRKDYNQPYQNRGTEDKEIVFPVGWKVNIEGLKDTNNDSGRRFLPLGLTHTHTLSDLVTAHKHSDTPWVDYFIVYIALCALTELTLNTGNARRELARS